MATEFINLVLYVFSVWLCVHIRWLDWPSRYTTLAWVRHCFPSHYPRSGQRSLQGGNVTGRIAAEPSKMDTLSLFIYFSFLFGLFPFILSHVVHSLLSLSRNYSYCLSLALFLYLLFWFVVLIFVQPPPPSLSLLLQLQLVCDWILSRLLRHTGGMCITHGVLWRWLTLYSLCLLLLLIQLGPSHDMSEIQ